MKTQNTTLEFRKESIIELQKDDLMTINGGTSLLYPSVIVLITELTK